MANYTPKLSSKGGTEMSTAANKALVHRWAEEVVSNGHLNTIDELFASNYVDHTNPPDWPLGSVGHKQIIALYHTAFPDFHYTIELFLASLLQWLISQRPACIFFASLMGKWLNTGATMTIWA